jgi:hypothetical protein
VDELPKLIKALEELRFNVTETTMQFRAGLENAVDKDVLRMTLDNFIINMNNAVEIYNRSAPQEISSPPPVRVPGL